MGTLLTSRGSKFNQLSALQTGSSIPPSLPCLLLSGRWGTVRGGKITSKSDKLKIRYIRVFLNFNVFAVFWHELIDIFIWEG